ncbi:MAG: HEAT repeat domain-containing protein [Planctomycetota bacterium]
MTSGFLRLPILASALLSAGNAGEPQPAAAASETSQAPVFFLRDGGQVAGSPQFESLRVETPYGALTVPRAELVEVRFALRLKPELKARIEAALSRLGDEDFDVREAASADLEAVGAPALPFLREALQSPVEEVHSRAAEILKAIETAAEKKAEGPESARGSDDEVVTTRMTIRGCVNQESFAIVTPFGRLEVAAADVAAIHFGAVRPVRAKVTVGAQHQAPLKWLDTKIDIQKGQILRLAASGQISVRNYGISSGPGGNTEWSGHGSFGNLPMLSLVGKIGRTGKPFLAGASYRGKPSEAGRLYLAIVPFTPNPTGASGAYQVTVQTQPGQ